MPRCKEEIGIPSAFFGLLLCCTVPIFFGIFFGIYFPFVHREWEDSTCRITGMKQYEQQWEGTWSYLQYKVAVEIDGKEYPAYGCESNTWHGKIDYKTGGGYPYEYVPCDGYLTAGEKREDHKIANLINGRCLDDQLFMPKWLCSNY